MLASYTKSNCVGPCPKYLPVFGLGHNFPLKTIEMYRTLITACSLLPRTCSAGCDSSVNIWFFDQIPSVSAWAHSWYKVLRNYDYFCCLGVFIYLFLNLQFILAYWAGFTYNCTRAITMLKKLLPTYPSAGRWKNRGRACASWRVLWHQTNRSKWHLEGKDTCAY